MKIDKDILINEFEILKKFNVLNIYPYGSRVYGTHSNESDYDFIVVVREGVGKIGSIDARNGLINIVIFGHNEFLKLIENHDVTALECIYLPKEDIIEESIDYRQFFHYDMQKLRQSISMKSNHCWTKARRKFEIEKDYNVGKKSIFHTIRVLSLGCTLAEYEGEMETLPYSEVNHLWTDIKNDKSTDWKHYKDKWRLPTYRRLLQEFKSLAPKI